MLRLQLNQNVLNLKESATLAINLAARAARSNGEDVCHFGFGQSPFPVHGKIQKALADNAHQKDYLSTRGLPELRQNIVDYHKKYFDYELEKENIIVGPGSKEMIFQLLYILEGPVFVPAPSWVSYGPQVNLRGNRIHPVQTKKENSYKLQAQEFEAALKDGGQAQNILILNNPTNPTGALYSKEEIEALAKVCDEHNVIVISDEIYSLVNFSGRPYSGFHHFCPERTIITSGLSKSHGAGGYRLGFLAAPKGFQPVMKALCAMVSETFSAVAAPIQYAAAAAYSCDDEIMDHVDQCTKIHKAVGEYMQEVFVKAGLDCPKPEGAFYLMPDFNIYKDALEKVGVRTSEDSAPYLFDKYKVAVLPGSDFYREPSDLCLRVATVDYDGEVVYESALKSESIGNVFVEDNCPHIVEGCRRITEFVNSLSK